MKKNNKDYLLVVEQNCASEIEQWLETNKGCSYNNWEGFFHGGRREKCYQVTPEDKKTTVFLKCFNCEKAKSSLFFFRFFSKAWRAFHVSRVLVEKGINRPEPLAYTFIKTGPNAGLELLFIRWLEATQPLGPFMDDFVTRPRDAGWQQKKRALGRKLALFVQKLHQQGIYHGDFNINNILVREQEDFKLFLVDTNDVRSLHWISYRRIMKNLDEVNRFFLDTRVITRTDRLRFLKFYLGEKARNKKTLRKYWSRIQARTTRRLKIHHKEFKK